MYTSPLQQHWPRGLTHRRGTILNSSEVLHACLPHDSILKGDCYGNTTLLAASKAQHMRSLCFAREETAGPHPVQVALPLPPLRHC